MTTLADVVSVLRTINTTTIDTWRETMEMRTDLKDFYKTLIKNSDALAEAVRNQTKESQDRFKDAQQEAESKNKFDKDKEDDGKNKDGGNALTIGALGAAVGLTALGAALFAFVNRWNTVRDDFTDAQKKIHHAIQGFVAALNPMFLLKAIRASFALLTGGLSELVISRITKFVKGLFSADGKGLFGKIGKTVSNVFKRIKSALKPLTGLFSIMGKVFKFIINSPIFKVIGGVIKYIGKLSGIFTVFVALFDAIRAGWLEYQAGGDTISIVIAAIKGALKGFTQLFADMGMVFGWVTERILRFIGVSEETAALWRGRIEGVFATITNVLNDAIDFLANIWETIIRFITRFIDNDLAGVIDTVTEFFGGIGERISSIIGGITDFGFDSISAIIQNVMDNFNAVKNGFTAFFEGIGNRINGIKRFLGIGDDEAPEPTPTGLEHAERVSGDMRRERDERSWTGFAVNPRTAAIENPQRLQRLEQEAMRRMTPERSASNGGQIDRSSRDVSQARVSASSQTNVVDSSTRSTTNVQENVTNAIMASPRPRNARDVSSRYSSGMYGL